MVWRIVGAALKALLPACVALIMQEPAASKFALLPLTVQTAGVVEANVTGSPDVAVALSVTEVPCAVAGMAGKVIVCECSVTANVLETSGAVAQVESPGCDATNKQVPADKLVTTFPETEQTLGVVEL